MYVFGGIHGVEMTGTGSAAVALPTHWSVDDADKYRVIVLEGDCVVTAGSRTTTDFDVVATGAWRVLVVPLGLGLVDTVA